MNKKREAFYLFQLLLFIIPLAIWLATCGAYRMDRDLLFHVLVILTIGVDIYFCHTSWEYRKTALLICFLLGTISRLFIGISLSSTVFKLIEGMMFIGWAILLLCVDRLRATAAACAPVICISAVGVFVSIVSIGLLPVSSTLYDSPNHNLTAEVIIYDTGWKGDLTVYFYDQEETRLLFGSIKPSAIGQYLDDYSQINADETGWEDDVRFRLNGEIIYEYSGHQES